MNWIIEIYRNSVNILNDNNYKSVYEVKSGWQANVDKVDEIYIVSLKDIVNKDNIERVIHLGMLPVKNTTVMWKNIDDIYRTFDMSVTVTKIAK